eukprot:XP_001704356.1 Hypothetical protein GL50803_23552 [Giardia lamblia ATCC 50803]
MAPNHSRFPILKMSSNNARAVAETLEAKKKEVVEDGLSVARILKKNVIAINKHLQEEDAMVVDEVHSKTRENQAKLEAEALALKKSLVQVVAGTKQRRQMFGFILLTIIAVGLLCRVT